MCESAHTSMIDCVCVRTCTCNANEFS